MPTIKDFRIYQRGPETGGRGIAVPATARWIGNLDLREIEKVYRPDYPYGLRVPYGTDAIVAKGAELAYSSDLTFEELVDFLIMGIKGGVTGVGEGNDKTWTFTLDPDDDPVPDTFTVEVVNDDGTTKFAREIEYVFAKRLGLTSGIDEAMKFSADLVGRQVTDCEATPGIGIPSAWEMALSNKLNLSIDDSWATLGNTPKAGIMIDMNLDVVTGLVPGLPQGQLYFGAYRFGPVTIDLTMTFEFTSVADAEQEKMRTRDRRYVRLEVLGSALGGGTKKIRIDLCGKHAEDSLMGPLSEREGQDTLTMHLQGVYDSTAKVIEFVVVNSLSAIA